MKLQPAILEQEKPNVSSHFCVLSHLSEAQLNMNISEYSLSSSVSLMEMLSFSEQSEKPELLHI